MVHRVCVCVCVCVWFANAVITVMLELISTFHCCCFFAVAVSPVIYIIAHGYNCRKHIFGPFDVFTPIEYNCSISYFLNFSKYNVHK